MNKQKYLDYLKSKDWSNKKESYKKSKYKKYCYVCHADDIPLQLHHRTYKRLYNESLVDLTYLCDRCHLLVHKYQKTFDVPLKEAARKFKQLLGLRKRNIRNSHNYKQIASQIIDFWSISVNKNEITALNSRTNKEAGKL